MTQQATIKDLGDIPLFKSLSTDQKKRIADKLRLQSFDKGEILFQENKPCEQIFFVKTGRVKIYKIGSSGREQVLQILQLGESCICHPGGQQWECTSTSEAMTKTDVWMLATKDLAKLAEKIPELHPLMSCSLANKLKNMSSLVENVSLKDTRQRVVQFLLDMMEASQSNGVSNEINLPYTREEIAQRLGTARETVARNLTQLQKEKLITISARRIRLLNPAKLRLISDGI